MRDEDIVKIKDRYAEDIPKSDTEIIQIIKEVTITNQNKLTEVKVSFLWVNMESSSIEQIQCRTSIISYLLVLMNGYWKIDYKYYNIIDFYGMIHTFEHFSALHNDSEK